MPGNFNLFNNDNSLHTKSKKMEKMFSWSSRNLWITELSSWFNHALQSHGSMVYCSISGPRSTGAVNACFHNGVRWLSGDLGAEIFPGNGILSPWALWPLCLLSWPSLPSAACSQMMEMGVAFVSAAVSWWFLLSSLESVLVLVCELQKNPTYQVPWGNLWPSITNSVGASVPRKRALTSGVGKLWHTSVIDKYNMCLFISMLVSNEKYPWWIQHGLHQDKYISLGLLLRGLQIHTIWRGTVYD